MQRVNEFQSPPLGQIFEHAGEVRLLYKNEVIGLHDEQVMLNLSEYGVSNHTGQLGVSNGGTIFANTRGQSTSLLSKWKTFRRKKESASKGGGKSLLKCSLNQKCLPWGNSVFQFDRAWSMFDLGNSRFIINDTSRHQIYLSNEDGDVLDKLDNFYFPNHLLDYQGSNWIVNTNTNSLIEIDVADDELTRTGKSIVLKEFSGIPRSYRFPSIAYANDDTIFALIHTSSMNQGKVFWLNNGIATRQFEHLNDITSLFLNDDTLYVSDYETHTIWSKDLVTGQEVEIVNEAYQQSLKRTQKNANSEWKKYIFHAFLCLGFGVFSLIYAVLKSSPTSARSINVDKEKLSVGAQSVSTLSAFQADGTIHWVELDEKQIKRIGYIKRLPLLMGCFTALSIIGLLLTFYFAESKPISDLQLPFASLTFITVFIFVLSLFTKKLVGENYEKLTHKLAWDGEFIYLRNINKQTQALPVDVFYSQNSLYANGVSIPLQFSGNLVYNKDSFETLITPVLHKANKLSMFGLIRHQFKNGHSETVFAVAMIPISIAMLIGLQLLIYVL